MKKRQLKEYDVVIAVTGTCSDTVRVKAYNKEDAHEKARINTDVINYDLHENAEIDILEIEEVSPAE